MAEFQDNRSVDTTGVKVVKDVEVMPIVAPPKQKGGKLMAELQEEFDELLAIINDEQEDAEDVLCQVEAQVTKIMDMLRKRGILNQEWGV